MILNPLVLQRCGFVELGAVRMGCCVSALHEMERDFRFVCVVDERLFVRRGFGVRHLHQNINSSRVYRRIFGLTFVWQLGFMMLLPFPGSPVFL